MWSISDFACGFLGLFCLLFLSCSHWTGKNVSEFLFIFLLAGGECMCWDVESFFAGLPSISCHVLNAAFSSTDLFLLRKMCTYLKVTLPFSTKNLNLCCAGLNLLWCIQFSSDCSLRRLRELFCFSISFLLLQSYCLFL